MQKHGAYTKYVLFALFCAFVIFLNFTIRFAKFGGSDPLSNEITTPLCTTPACIKSAASILRNLNLEVDPCDDFYEFACGGWIRSHVIPEDQQEISQFSNVQHQVNLAIKSLLEQPDHPKDPTFYAKARNLYRSCINLQSIEAGKEQPLKNALELLGGWPVLNSQWKPKNFALWDVLIKLRRLGFNHNILIKAAVEADERNNTINVIKIDEGAKISQSLRRKRLLEREAENNEDEEEAESSRVNSTENVLETLKNNSDFRHVHKFMVDTAVLLGADPIVAEKDMLDTYLLELVLENFTMNQEDSRNITLVYNKMTLTELIQFAPNIPWLPYLQSILNQTLTGNETVIVLDKKYLSNLNQIIESIERKTLANYVLWRVVYESLPLLSRKYRDLLYDYNRYFTGQDREEPRWKSCVDLVNQQLNTATSSMYVRHYFRESSKNKTQEIVDYLINEFVHTLEHVKWMDEKTRHNAVDKARTMKTYVGYTEELRNASLIDELYEDLQLSPKNFFANLLLIRKYDTDASYAELRLPNSRGDWRNHLQGVKINAFYFSIENSIDILPGILHAPFFDENRPNYLNFGGIGFVVGHEFTHGFDDLGKEFDKYGNYRNWWDNMTNIRFREKTQCIIDQYNKYQLKNGLKVNGVLTQGENIADNGGAKEAFKAYKQWVKDHGEESALPGLNFTPEQLLFISTANIWCEVQRDEALKIQMAEDEHSPSSVRVNGAMGNNLDFLHSFNCPSHSRMNLRQKCEIF